MTPRKILILCASRKIFENGISYLDVSRVVDDEARTANREIRNYYMNCSERALKMLDNAVLNRVRYLESLSI